MFKENENLVEESTENVEEQTTEENHEEVEETADTTEQSDVEEGVEDPKQEETCTREQVDEMNAKKIARKEAKIRREYENKYSRLETVVNTVLGTNSIEESTSKLEDF